MSAIDQMRASLDQLMGTTRDGESNKFKLRYDDPKVCRSFLLGCCPHEILSSTRLNLGECPKIHDLAFKADYKNAYNSRRVDYDHDVYEHLSAFLDDCDKRTEISKRKLKETQEELSKEAAANADKIFNLGEQIGKTLAEAEKLGAEGNVEESMLLLEKVEELKKDKLQAEADFRNSMPASSHQQQKLRMCEVCCAFLGIHDNDRQLADHFEGKLHLGFIAIRQKIEELKGRIDKNRDNVRESREVDSDRRRKEEKERPRDARRSTSRSKSSRPRRSRSRSRGYRSSRDKRSRSRDRRSRSRDRRSRSRDRGKDRHRRQRSQSRERYRKRSRSVSKDRKSKRSRSRSASKSHRISRRSRSSSRKRADRKSDSKHRSRSSSRIKDVEKSKSNSSPVIENNSDVCIDTSEPCRDANDTNDSIPEDGEVKENGD